MSNNQNTNVHDDMLQLLFSKLGIEASIMLLYDYLREQINFEHLIFTWLDINNKMWIPVIELDDGEPTYSTPKSFTDDIIESNEGPFKEDVFRIDDIFVYKDVISFFSSTMPKRRSMICMVLYRDKNSLLSISIGSTQSNAFRPEHEKIFVQLKMLFKNLAKNLDLSYYSRFSYLAQKENAYGLLKQCNGLSNTIRYVEGAAKTNQIVLINGETGVGKDLVAKAIHELSDRSKNNFVVCNCGAIPETLIDSEFFGYEKGAFTGAVSNRQGYFEQASEGTIFLDEIAELPFLAQARLLRVLETQEIRRVGGVRNININTRIIAATNKDLEKMVAEGKFREDLWHRLNVINITVPTLRSRRGDVVMLTQYFLQQCIQRKSNNNSNIAPVIQLETYAKLCGYFWPGNVRQLRNSVEKAYFRYIMTGEAKLQFDELRLPTKQKNSKYDTNSLQDKNVEWICDALKKSKGAVEGTKGAANILNINPNTLRTKMRKYKIKASDFRS